MSFRETQKRGTANDARGVAGTWLHALLFEDWWLKLFAFVIALGLWYAVTGQRAPVTVRLRGVLLEFVRPTDIEISNDPVEDVDVTLEGSQGKLAEINARNLVARADITSLKPGDRVARLNSDNVTMDLPEGVRILKIEPSSVALRLEPILEREVEVEARFEGKLPEGYTRGKVQITPERVRVRGPESRVNALKIAHTETIPLEDQRESVTLPSIAVDIPDRRVTPLDPVVSVRIEINGERIEKYFANVSVISPSGGGVQPASVGVTLRGARAVIERVRADELRITLEQSPDGTLAPHLNLPSDLEGRIELVSTTPARFAANE